MSNVSCAVRLRFDRCSVCRCSTGDMHEINAISSCVGWHWYVECAQRVYVFNAFNWPSRIVVRLDLSKTDIVCNAMNIYCNQWVVYQNSLRNLDDVLCWCDFYYYFCLNNTSAFRHSISKPYTSEATFCHWRCLYQLFVFHYCHEIL